MLKIGLTGGIGSGKTIVSDTFAELGITVIDTDVIAREVLETDENLLSKLSDSFGESILMQDGNKTQLNRPILREIAFSSEENKKQLDAIMHPAIRSASLNQIETEAARQKKLAINSYCIIVVPLLIETGFIKLVDRVLVVTAPLENKLKWLKKRSNLDTNQALKIIQKQSSDEEKIALADDVIQNNSDIPNLKKAVLQLHETYLGLT
jgi:dephospho-CoA kinase